MLEISPIKRLMKNIELIKDNPTQLENNIKKIEEKQINRTNTRTGTSLQTTDTTKTLRTKQILNSHEKNPIELQGLSITRHQDEIIKKHHELHNTIKNIRKQSKI